jgi:hypothetical protein
LGVPLKPRCGKWRLFLQNLPFQPRGWSPSTEFWLSSTSLCFLYHIHTHGCHPTRSPSSISAAMSLTLSEIPWVSNVLRGGWYREGTQPGLCHPSHSISFHKLGLPRCISSIFLGDIVQFLPPNSMWPTFLETALVRHPHSPATSSAHSAKESFLHLYFSWSRVC